MHHVRKGHGSPLLLIHGLGGSWRSWDTIIDELATHREVIAVDLPGSGATPSLPGPPSIAALADALVDFLAEHDLRGIDVAGSSMGARLALELARRGEVGAAVALDPGGFWAPRERRIFGASIALSIRLLRLLSPLLPAITASAVGRTILLAQFSARPWRLPGSVALQELRSFEQSPAVDATLRELVDGPTQEGLPAGAARGPIVIGWGQRDLVCFPRQAARAQRQFPDARLVWFDGCGHFPHWDRPEKTIRVVLEATGQRLEAAAAVS